VGRMQALQAADGSWPLYHGGPGSLSTTIEAYFAMKLAGVPIDDPALVRAREFIRAHGGLQRAGVFTRTLLAYFGQFRGGGLLALRVGLVLLPRWSPLNIYARSSWGRGTVLPLPVLMAKQPRIAIRAGCGVEELWLAAPTPQSIGFPPSREWFSVRNAFLALDWVLQRLGRSPWKPWRAPAARRAQEGIIARPDRNGGRGGIPPPLRHIAPALRAPGRAHAPPAL